MVRKSVCGFLTATLFAVACVSTSSCTFIVKRDAAQCSTDADCTGRGPAFEGTFCSDRKVCQSSLTYCFSNQQCIDRNKGAPFICRKSLDHTCVPLLTAECPRVIGDPADLRNDDAIVLGTVMMPTWNALLKAAEDSIELAVNDLKTTAGGLKGTTGNGTPRPVLVNACEITLPNQIANQPAADHLIGDLHVPAVIGPLPAAWISYAFQKSLAANPKTVLVTPSSATGPEFTNAPGRIGILFRTGDIAPSLAASQAQFISNYYEPQIRKDRGIDATVQLKYAVVATGRGPESDVIDGIYKSLTLNGKTLPQNGANYKEFSYGDPTAPDFDAKLANMLVDIQNFKPDIVALYGSQEVPAVVLQIEKLGLPAAPYYTGTAGALVSNVLPDYVGSDDKIRRRIAIFQPGRGSTDPGVARFYQRLGAAYPEDVPNELAALVFDSTYMVFYALAAAGDKPVTPDILGSALLTKMQTGPAINVGPTDMLNAIGAMESGGGITFKGIEADGNFDANGDIATNYQVFCVDNTVTDGDLVGFRASGLKYDPVTKQLTGTNGCAP